MSMLSRVTLVLELGREWKFEELEAGSIALDGAVQGPRVDAATRRFSFDHHAGCVRLLTSATCRQVFDALLLGLDPTGMKVHVNDLDGDTVMSLWLLEHADRWRDRDRVRAVRPLVELVSTIDAHGPAYPVDDPERARTFFEAVLGPLGSARNAGYPSGALSALSDALSRVETWFTEGLPVRPRTGTAPPEPDLMLEPTWVLATLPPGGDRVAATAAVLYEKGHHRLIVAGRSPGGGWRYLIARRSDLVAGFPLDRFYAALNERERDARGHPLGQGQTWGGGSSVGGGPRLDSVLDPRAVRDVIAAVLAAS